MTARLRQESGFTLMEVMVAATLLIIVIGATLGTMTEFDTQTRANQLQNEAQETARNAVDQVARELRNTGVGTPSAPQGVRKSSPFDLVFQTVKTTMPAGSANSYNLKFVRYCLDYSVATNEKLYRQDYTWTSASVPAVPSTASCPDPGWSNTTIVADQLYNNANGNTRALFTPNATLTRVGITAYVNANRGGASNQPVRESRLDTAVALRNQDAAPHASFTAVATGNGHLILNASDSSDPDNDPLNYAWAYDGTTIPSATGVTLDYQPTPFSGSHTVTLTVTDPSGVTDTSTQTVNLG
jgi:type II secretory pathway pseudopilin PulG